MKLRVEPITILILIATFIGIGAHGGAQLEKNGKDILKDKSPSHHIVVGQGK